MNCPHVSLRSALTHSSAALLALIPLALFFAAGCDQSTSVSGTVPQNGETEVDPKSTIQITYATSFSTKRDDQAKLTDPGNFQVSGRSGKQYKGTVAVASSGRTSSTRTATSKATTANTQDSTTKKSDSTTTTSQKLNDTLVFTLATGASFDVGDVIKVRVGGQITVRGVSVSTHTFTFRVRGVEDQAALGDLRVLTASPDPEKLGVRQPIRITADFSRAVKQDRLAPTAVAPSAITIRGEFSGVHVVDAGETSFPRNAGDKKVLQVKQEPGSEFLPGEWVTVSLSDEIEGADAPGGAAAGVSNKLQPFSSRFQMIPGRPTDGNRWGKLPASAFPATGIERPFGAVAADVRTQITGTEFVVISPDRVDLFSQEANDLWASKSLDAKALGAEQGMAVSDAALADLDGSGSSLVVLLTGPGGSQVRTYEMGADGLVAKDEPLSLPAAQARRLLVSDLDSNGLLDLVVTHPSREYDARETDGSTHKAVTGNVSIVALTRGALDLTKILSGEGSAFSITRQLIADPIPDLPPVERIEFRDLDGDGKCDLVVETEGVENAPGKVLLVQNRSVGSGRFRFGISRELRGRGGLGSLAPRAWTAADLDADGDVDIAAWDANGSLFYENPLNPKVKKSANAVVRTLLTEDVKPAPLGLPAAQEDSLPPLALDMNGDALIDLVLASKSRPAVQLFLGKQGSAREFEVVQLPALAVGGSLAAVTVADVDGDTGLDLVGVGDGSRPGAVVDVIRSDGAEIEGEVLTSSFKIDPEGTVIGEDEIVVPVAGDIADPWFGYTVVLDYEENRLEFLGFDRSPRFPSATYTFCPDDNGSGCAGFASMMVKLDTQISSKQGPTGNGILLGTFHFKPKSVSSRTTADIFLANNLSRTGNSSDAASIANNSLLVAEGTAQKEQAVALAGDPIEVELLPKPLKIVRSEVVGIQDGIFLVKLVWTALGAFTDFYLSVDGEAKVRVEPTTTEEGYVATVSVYTGDRHTVRVTGDRPGKLPLTESTQVATIFQPTVTCSKVFRSGKSEIHNTVEWHLEGKVDGFQIWKNGFASASALSSTTRSFTDDSAVANGADTYEVAGVIKIGDSTVLGPRGQCTGVDPEPNSTEAPSDLRIESGPRASAQAPTSLVLSWTNGEAYDSLHLSIARDDGTPAGQEVYSEDLNFHSDHGAWSQYPYDGDPRNPSPGGVPPHRYRFSLVAKKNDQQSETRNSVGWFKLDVPPLGENFNCTVAMGNEVSLSWDQVWRGYTDLTLVAEGPEETRRIQLDLEAADFRETVVPQGSYVYTLKASYEGPLPANFAVNPATLQKRCDPISFAPTLRVGLVETGVGLSSARIPILADFFSSVGEVSFSILFPSQFRVELDPLHPRAVVRLNDQDDAKVKATMEDWTNDEKGRPRKRISVQIEEASFPPLKDQTLLWIVGSVDHDFARAGTFPLKFDGDITVKPRGSTDALRIGADDAAGQLVIHKRFVVLDRAEVAIGDTRPVLIRVLATFDQPPEGPANYGLAAFQIHLKYNPKLLKLEPVVKADQRESVAASKGLFILNVTGSTAGDYRAVWIGAGGGSDDDNPVSQINPGMDLPLLFLKFTPKIPEDPAGDFASIRFVRPSLSDGDSNDFPTVFTPWDDPKVGQPLEGYFTGGINIKPAQPVPTLLSVTPARGPLGGGGKVLANGFGFLPEDQEAQEDARLFLVHHPLLGDPVPREAQVTSKSNYLLEFIPPAAGFDPPPAVSVDFDLEFQSPRGRSVLQNAYRYDALRITATDRSSGSPSGSEAMAIYGYGIGPVTGSEADTRVEFRIQAVPSPLGPPEGTPAAVFPGENVEVDPDGTRLRLVTPAMADYAGKLADVYVATPIGRDAGGQIRWAEDRVPVPYLISSTPKVINVNPARGPAAGGTKVTIEVVGFPSPLNAGSAVDVKFGGVRATVATAVGPAKLEATTPAGSFGAVDVTVVHGASLATIAGGFEYLQPRILSITPAEGPAGGGTQVTVHHENFDSLSNFELFFGGQSAAPTVIDAQNLSAKAPAHQGAGVVAVRLRRGQLEDTVQSGFTYRVPGIAEVNPATGATSGGTVVTIRLSDFGVISSPQVKFGAVAAEVQSTGTDQVVVKSPAAAGPGPVDVTVTAGVYSATRAGGFTYAGQAPLTITSVEPAEGPICGGQKVIVRGTGFSSTPQVRFGSEPNWVLSPSVELLDSGRAEVVIPSVAENVTAVTVGVSIGGQSFVDQAGLFTYQDDRPPFIRGDVDHNLKLDLTDSVIISQYISGAAVAILNLDAADCNDDGVVNGGDAVLITNAIFNTGEKLPPPESLGMDPTPDGIRGCAP